MSLELNKRMFTFNFTRLVATAATIIAMCVVYGIFTDTAAQTVEDSASIFEFVEAYQRTISTRDPAALSAFFTDDADFVMYNLPHVQGRQAIENWWQDFWQSKFNRQEPERRGTFNLNSVRFIAADVAIAEIKVTTGGIDSLGVELQTRNARGTWLLVRQNGNWLISAMLGMPTEEDSVILKPSPEAAKILMPKIRVFVDAYESAFNNHDPDAVSAFFRNDADMIVRNGSLIQGWEEIKKWWGDYFSKPRPYRALFIIDKIRMIDSNIALLNIIATGINQNTEAEQSPLRYARGTWILVHESGEWLISALRVLPGKDDRIIRKFY